MGTRRDAAGLPQGDQKFRSSAAIASCSTCPMYSFASETEEPCKKRRSQGQMRLFVSLNQSTTRQGDKERYHTQRSGEILSALNTE